MKLTPEIRNRLRTVLESKHVTGYTIKEKLGISATTICNYINENSKTKKADSIKIETICKFLGITKEWLESGVDMVKSPEECPELQEDQPDYSSIRKSIEEIKIRIDATDLQFSNIRKDNSWIHNQLQEQNTTLVSIKKDLHELTKTIQKLIDKQE